jgi:hypothetical protein
LEHLVDVLVEDNTNSRLLWSAVERRVRRGGWPNPAARLLLLVVGLPFAFRQGTESCLSRRVLVHEHEPTAHVLPRVQLIPHPNEVGPRVQVRATIVEAQEVLQEPHILFLVQAASDHPAQVRTVGGGLNERKAGRREVPTYHSLRQLNPPVVVTRPKVHRLPGEGLQAKPIASELKIGSSECLLFGQDKWMSRVERARPHLLQQQENRLRPHALRPWVAAFEAYPLGGQDRVRLFLLALLSLG